ncbi:MAG: hypothetical protein K6G56_07575 [Clostridiales bacterium]|nr:hypothetical protein [Clostridiales bacterium]
MLFGVSFCRGCGRVKRRRGRDGFPFPAVMAILAALVFTALLFLAPQWLLVLLVLFLTLGIIALVCLPCR